MAANLSGNRPVFQLPCYETAVGQPQLRSTLPSRLPANESNNPVIVVRENPCFNAPIANWSSSTTSQSEKGAKKVSVKLHRLHLQRAEEGDVDTNDTFNNNVNLSFGVSVSIARLFFVG